MHSATSLAGRCVVAVVYAGDFTTSFSVAHPPREAMQITAKILFIRSLLSGQIRLCSNDCKLQSCGIPVRHAQS